MTKKGRTSDPREWRERVLHIEGKTEANGLELARIFVEESSKKEHSTRHRSIAFENGRATPAQYAQIVTNGPSFVSGNTHFLAFRRGNKTRTKHATSSSVT